MTFWWINLVSKCLDPTFQILVIIVTWKTALESHLMVVLSKKLKNRISNALNGFLQTLEKMIPAKKWIRLSMMKREAMEIQFQCSSTTHWNKLSNKLTFVRFSTMVQTILINLMWPMLQWIMLILTFPSAAICFWSL